MRIHQGLKADYTMRILFHGAAMAKDGCACVFLCPTGGGKSTLSVYLYKNGYEYLSDDRVEIAAETQTVTGRYKPIELRPGGYMLLRSMGILSEEEADFDASPGRERYRFFPRRAKDASVPLGEIFLIKRTDKKNCAKPIEKSEAIRIMMENAAQPVPVSGDYLRALSLLSEKLRKEISYCDMDFLKEIIDGGHAYE